jgi:hypothetical protein
MQELLALTDSELARACTTNFLTNNICSTREFWELRINHYYPNYEIDNTVHPLIQYKLLVGDVAGLHLDQAVLKLVSKRVKHINYIAQLTYTDKVEIFISSVLLLCPSSEEADSKESFFKAVACTILVRGERTVSEEYKKLVDTFGQIVSFSDFEDSLLKQIEEIRDRVARSNLYLLKLYLLKRTDRVMEIVCGLLDLESCLKSHKLDNSEEYSSDLLLSSFVAMVD